MTATARKKRGARKEREVMSFRTEGEKRWGFEVAQPGSPTQEKSEVMRSWTTL